MIHVDEKYIVMLNITVVSALDQNKNYLRFSTEPRPMVILVRRYAVSKSSSTGFKGKSNTVCIIYHFSKFLPTGWQDIGCYIVNILSADACCCVAKASVAEILNNRVWTDIAEKRRSCQLRTPVGHWPTGVHFIDMV